MPQARNASFVPISRPKGVSRRGGDAGPRDATWEKRHGGNYRTYLASVAGLWRAGEIGRSLSSLPARLERASAASCRPASPPPLVAA